MENIIELLVNDYIDDDFYPSRQLKFVITEECLMDYLTEVEDGRTIGEFVSTYNSDESSVIYEYATDDSRVLSEEISYCDDFLAAYADYADVVLFPKTKEVYYWEVYRA